MTDDIAPTLDDGARGASVELPMIAFDWQASAGNDESWRGKGRQHVVRSGDYAGAVSATRTDAIFGEGVARSLTARNERIDAESENLPVASPVRASDGHHGHSSGRGDGADNLIAQTLNGSYAKTTASAGSHGSGAPVNDVHGSQGVRRLTLLECERLQGWPDDWTKYTADDKEVPDSHRYRMIGNGVASPCAEWIGHRLVMADSYIEAAA